MLTLFLFGMVAKGEIARSRTVAKFSKIQIRQASLLPKKNSAILIRAKPATQIEISGLNEKILFLPPHDQPISKTKF